MNTWIVVGRLDSPWILGNYWTHGDTLRTRYVYLDAFLRINGYLDTFLGIIGYLDTFLGIIGYLDTFLGQLNIWWSGFIVYSF